MGDIVDRKKYGERMRGFPGIKQDPEAEVPETAPSASPTFDAIRAHLLPGEPSLPSQARTLPKPSPTPIPTPSSDPVENPYSDEAYKALLEEVPTAGKKKKK